RSACSGHRERTRSLNPQGLQVGLDHRDCDRCGCGSPIASAFYHDAHSYLRVVSWGKCRENGIGLGAYAILCGTRLTCDEQAILVARVERVGRSLAILDDRDHHLLLIASDSARYGLAKLLRLGLVDHRQVAR